MKLVTMKEGGREGVNKGTKRKKRLYIVIEHKSTKY